LATLPKGGLALQVENSFVLSVVQNSFVLLIGVHGTFFVDVQRICYHIE
jgi:hypothetical protein